MRRLVLVALVSLPLIFASPGATGCGTGNDGDDDSDKCAEIMPNMAAYKVCKCKEACEKRFKDNEDARLDCVAEGLFGPCPLPWD